MRVVAWDMVSRGLMQEVHRIQWQPDPLMDWCPPGTRLFTFPLGCSYVLVTLLSLTGREGCRPPLQGTSCASLLVCDWVRDGSLLTTPSSRAWESEWVLLWVVSALFSQDS